MSAVTQEVTASLAEVRDQAWVEYAKVRAKALVVALTGGAA